MNAGERDLVLARSVEDFRQRMTRGESPIAEDYADTLADAFDDFLTILDVEALLDDLLEPPVESLPRVFGPYRLVRELGRGASGIVYEAVNQPLSRREAVKILRGGLDARDVAFERFRQEARVLASADHPNIVEIYGAGQVDGRPYFAMALLEGASLSELIRRGEQPAPREICGGLAGVADALESLHEREIVHRDVKPSNIMVEPDGRMVLADFGLARALERPRLTRTGQSLGTPLYMSPEQVLGRADEIDGRTDLYSLGATLYEALAGRPLFDTNDLGAMMQMVIAVRPEPLRRVAPDVPGDCADIAMKAVEKRREDRYPDAAYMGADLRRVASGKPPLGRPISAARHGLRRIRRYALPIAAVVVLGVALALWLRHRPGTLTVYASCAAVVLVDGVPHGTAPIEVRLAPGEYEVSFRHDLVDPGSHAVHLGAGENRSIYVVPARAHAPDDVETFEFLLESAGVEGRSRPSNGRLRRAVLSEYRAVVPSGRLRIQDLGGYVLEVSESAGVPEGTRLVFRRGDEVLHAGAWSSLFTHPEERPIPAAVLDALKPGDVVTWGLEVPGAADVMTSFEIVEDDPDLREALARVDRVLAKQVPALRAAARAEVLLRHDLPYSAYGEVRGVLDPTDPTRSGLAPWIQRQKALMALGLGEDSALWGTGENAIWYAFDRPVAAEWYADRPDGD